MSAVESVGEQAPRVVAGATGAPGGRRVGRFELLRVLGKGAQATVWLAHDPRLDREVALKLLDPSTDAQSVNEWLNEARAVSRLAHPNVVPVFEADVASEAGSQPYLVFEYVEGPTLQQARRERVTWSARDAVTLLMGVLDALAAAHAQGIVHRDLKPSNVLLGSDGRPRVMDFGIAARVGQAPAPGSPSIVGTPGYLSPEAARGAMPVPAMDVFSAGAILAELLAGQPLLRETDPLRALQRVQEEDLSLPDHVRVDDQLRSIVQRALARDAAARFDSAAALQQALAAWLNPGEVPKAEAAHGTLEFLLRRMKLKTDFPALSDSIVRIQRLASSETESLGSLSDAILNDVALTNKLLRMVNTVHFAQAAGGGVSTVSRAVALVGFAGIRNMALSVVLMEHMGDKGHAAVLKEEFLRALMAGTLAGELTPLAREAEDAFIGSMFQNLGRLLTEYYFPEEAQHIRQQLPGTGPHGPAAREAAARRVLGLGYEDLGLGVARAWGLPDSLQRAMTAPKGDVPQRVLLPGVERLRWLGHGANALADALISDEGPAQQRKLLATAEIYAAAFGLSARAIVRTTNDTRGKLAQLADAMQLRPASGSVARRLIADSPAPGARAAPAADRAPGLAATAGSASAASSEEPDARTVLLPDSAARAAPGVATTGAPAVDAEILRASLVEVVAAVAGGQLRLNDLLHRVLLTLHGALRTRCVVFCLRDPRSGLLVGRFGLGEKADRFSAALRVDPARARDGDLFAALCVRGADTLISDAHTPSMLQRLPGWYRATLNAPTFLLLPLMHRGAPVGLIYADKARAGSLQLSADELALVKALRDQVLVVFSRGTG